MTTPPTTHADTAFARLVPYRLRWAHRAWASIAAYFWLPCILCGRPWGGHEWRRYEDGAHVSVAVPASNPALTKTKGICPVCAKAGLGSREEAGR
jgi:hypothetical protein